MSYSQSHVNRSMLTSGCTCEGKTYKQGWVHGPCMGWYQMDSLHKLASLTSDLFTLHADVNITGLMYGVHNSQQGSVILIGTHPFYNRGAVILTGAHHFKKGTVLQQGHSTQTGAVIPLVIVYPMHSHYSRGTFAGNGKYLLSIDDVYGVQLQKSKLYTYKSCRSSQEGSGILPHQNSADATIYCI